MDTLAPPILDTIDQILQHAWNQNRSILFEHEVYRILDLLELDTPPVHFIRGASDIPPQDLSRFSSDTLMMKIVSPTVAHKMAVNGVRSVYRDLDFLKYSCERLQQEVAALGITEIYNLRNAISPKVIVSYGNQLDVDPADLVAYFDRDPEVDVIGCYIEGFKAAGGRKFFNTARQTNTPIIVYKAGRTAAGKQATESHTASIAGEYEVAKAAMKQAGLIVAETMIDHGDFIKTFALLSDFDVRGNRVALIANAGYEKTYAADNLGRLQIAAFDPATHDALAKLQPPYVTVDPLLDLTPMAGDAMYADCIRTILQSDTVDALMISIVPHSILLHTTDDEIARTEGHLAERIVDLIHTYKKPTVVSVNVAFGACAVYNRFGQILDSGGMPTFLTANRAMICLNAFVHYRLTRHQQYRDAWLT